MKKIYIKKSLFIPIIIMLFFCFIVLQQADFIPASDDGRYAFALANRDRGLLVINNRVLINIIAIVVEACGVQFWKICNLIICIFLFLYLMKIALTVSEKEANVYINIIFLGMIFFIPINVLSSGLFWATGSFNYAWGVVGCLMFLYPFICKLFEKKITKVEIVLAVIGGIYAGNLEQTSAVQVCFTSIILGYLFLQKKKVDKKYWLLYIIGIISAFLVMFLPFNRGRSYVATKVYYPDFGMLSIMDKVYQGAINLYSHFANKANIIMLFLAGLVFYSLCKRTENKFEILMGLLPFVYFLGNIVIKSGVFLGDTINILYDFSIYRYENIINNTQIIPFIVMTGILLLEAYLLFIIFNKVSNGLCVALVYLAGLSSALVLSFSPTIFASGNRTFFLLDIFLVLIIGILLYKDETIEISYQYIALGIVVLVLMISVKFYFMCSGIILY